MARVNRVQKARVSKKPRTCRCGYVIQPGDSYYHWSNKIGPRSSITRYRCKDHPPKPSETTANQYQQIILAAIEDFDAAWSNVESPEEAVDALQAVADAAREIQETMETNADSIEDGFGHATYQSDELRERGEAWGEYADEIEYSIDDLGSVDTDACEQCGASETEHSDDWEEIDTNSCAICDVAAEDHTEDDHAFVEPEVIDHSFEAPDWEETRDEAEGKVQETPE